MQKLQKNLRFLNDNQVKETNVAIYLHRLPLILHSTAITPSGTATKFSTMGLNGEWHGSPSNRLWYGCECVRLGLCVGIVVDCLLDWNAGLF